MGKVLIIDEAYMLAGGSTTSGAGNSTDIYKIAVIDTIVAEVQSTAGEDRCVLLLGYKDQMEQMFQSVNPGLARRFPMSEAFTFEDYNDEQLLQIMDLKLKQQGFSVTDTSQTVAMEVLSRARNRPNFGNAGEIDIVLDRAKASIQKRLRSNKDIDLDVFAPEDFDPDYDRGSRAVTNCRELFKGVIGCEDVVSKLEGYQRVAVNMKVRKLDPRGQIPFSFLFKGPSGWYSALIRIHRILTHLRKAPERLPPRVAWDRFSTIWDFLLVPMWWNARRLTSLVNMLDILGRKSKIF